MKKRIIYILLGTLLGFNFSLFGQKSKKGNREKAYQFVQKGIELNNNSKSEIEFYQKAIESDSSYGAAYYNLGNVYFDLKDLDKAIYFYKTACELNPADRDYWYNLAFSYFKKRDYILSIESLNHILKMDKEKTVKDYEAVYLLVKIYARTQSQTTLNAARLLCIDILKEAADMDLRIRTQKMLQWLNQKLKIN